MPNVKTNNVPRFTLDWISLSQKEQESITFEGCRDETYIRYKGEVYPLSDFERMPDSYNANDWHGVWDGYLAQSAFSGIVIRFVVDDWGIDHDRVIIGRFWF